MVPAQCTEGKLTSDTAWLTKTKSATKLTTIVAVGGTPDEFKQEVAVQI